VILRPVALAVVGVAVAGLVVADRAQPDTVVRSTYGESTLTQTTPAVFEGDLFSTSWFCPGGPTVEGRATTLTIFNSTDAPREVDVSAVNVEGQRGTKTLTLPPRNRQVVDLAALAPGQHTAATVAVFGGGVAVEQTVYGRTGVAVSPCADRASNTWYLADGTTTADASLTLALYNPFPDDAVVDIALTTVERTLEPPALQGAVVPGRSVRLYDIGALAQREEVVSTSVVGRGARLVAGRIQSASNPARRGFSAGLAAARPQQTWWFPDGDKGEGVSERFVIYNPGDLDAEVELSFLPAAGVGLPPPPTATPSSAAPAPTPTSSSTSSPTNPSSSPASGAATAGSVGSSSTSGATSTSASATTAATTTTGDATTSTTLPPAVPMVAPHGVVVAASSFAVVDVNALPEVAAGPHSTVVNVVEDQTPVVVERVLSRPLDDRQTATVLLGSQITVPQWYVIEEAAARGGVLVVMNSAGLPTTVAVKAIGPAGAVPVPGLDAVPVPAGGAATITVPETVGGFPLRVEGAQPVVVEWRARVQAGERASRLDALAFPVIGG
jgi:uncharacterized protein DUF5719